MLLALLAHVLAGVRETMSIRPSSILPDTADRISEAAGTLERNWTQALCAFQLVTVDLLALTALSFLLAFTDLIPQQRPVALVLAGFFALWGVAWLVQLVVLKVPRKNYLLLGHWAFWFLCAGLSFWGAQSL
ncbi:MAG: hypothetical protein KJ634_14040 [Gammaproteobacteria bacterium]|nr:hypothetical protein [Gammaproteobacteria bacterium]MBU1416734.1 hypothetical protein [Gammaproteobacteria bacterium]